MNTDFHHIHLNVNDLQQFKTLLEKIADAKVIKSITVDEKEILQIDFKGVNIFLSPTNEERKPGIDHLGISTSTMKETTEKLVSAGWKEIDKKIVDDGLEQTFLKSPEGIVIELLETRS